MVFLAGRGMGRRRWRAAAAAVAVCCCAAVVASGGGEEEEDEEEAGMELDGTAHIDCSIEEAGTPCDDGLWYTHGDVCGGGVGYGGEGACAGTAVRNLTDADFSRVLDESARNQSVFLAWFWRDHPCWRCESQRPKLETAARELVQRDPPVFVGCVDGENSPTAAKSAGINHWPKGRLFHTGVLIPDFDQASFDNDDSVDKIVEWVPPFSVELRTAAAVRERTRKDIERPVVAGLFPLASTQAYGDFKIYTHVAFQFRDFVSFHHVTSTSALGDIGHLGRAGAVIGYRPWDRKKFKLMYKGKMFRQALTDWVADSVLSPVETCGRRKEFEKYMELANGLRRPVVRGFYLGADGAEEAGRQQAALRDRLGAAWRAARDVQPVWSPARDKLEPVRRVAFAVTDASEWVEYATTRDDVGFSDDDVRAGRAVIIEEGYKEKKKAVYKWTDGDGDVAGWVERYVQGRLSKWQKLSELELKSEEEKAADEAKAKRKAERAEREKERKKERDVIRKRKNREEAERDGAAAEEEAADGAAATENATGTEADPPGEAAGGAGGGAEKRVVHDGSAFEGMALTEEQFRHIYPGSTTEWEKAAPEKRVVDDDGPFRGMALTEQQFVRIYSGTAEWERARPAAAGG